MQARKTMRKSFSLIELLIAVSIASVILGMLYGSYFNTIRSITRCRGKLKEYKLARILFHKIKGDVNGIYALDDKDRQFLGKENKIEFVSTNSLGFSKPSESDLYNIKYYLLPSGPKEVNLCRNEDGVKFCFGKHFKQVKFTYYDGRKWLNEWDSNWMGRLPEGIKAAIAIEAEEGGNREFSSRFKVFCEK